ncbi:hypothetical protein scyTo_0019298, partial [Scyliorhinus torazame]|nr:hypothetical protein [Scyliorhinus torazame]
VLQNILEIECDYAEELTILLSTFLRPLQASDKLSSTDMGYLMGNLEDICSFQQILVQSLEECTKLPEFQQKVGGCFGNLMSQMKSLYLAYCANHPWAVHVLTQFSEELGEFMEIKGATSPGILMLTTSLSKPFMRLDKYPTLLKELERHMEEYHPDWLDIQRSMNAFQSLSSQCQEVRKKKELELQILTETVHGWEGEDIRSLGNVIYMSQVTVQCGNEEKCERYFLLFPHVLLMLSASPRMSAFIYQGKLPLTGLMVTRLDDSDADKNTFEITGSMIERILVSCSSYQDLQEWVDHLQKQTKTPSTAALEEDTQILKVIEAYCTSAKTRQTLNSTWQGTDLMHNHVLSDDDLSSLDSPARRCSLSRLEPADLSEDSDYDSIWLAHSYRMGPTTRKSCCSPFLTLIRTFPILIWTFPILIWTFPILTQTFPHPDPDLPHPDLDLTHPDLDIPHPDHPDLDLTHPDPDLPHPDPDLSHPDPDLPHPDPDLPILNWTFLILIQIFPIQIWTFPILIRTFPILIRTFPILFWTFLILIILIRTFPILIWTFLTQIILIRTFPILIGIFRILIILIRTFPILIRTYPILIRTFPILIRIFPTLKRILTILIRTFPILILNFPILIKTFPILIRTFPILIRAFPILIKMFPILIRTFPILIRAFPILIRTFPVLIILIQTFPILIRTLPILITLIRTFPILITLIWTFPILIQTFPILIRTFPILITLIRTFPVLITLIWTFPILITLIQTFPILIRTFPILIILIWTFRIRIILIRTYPILIRTFPILI